MYVRENLCFVGRVVYANLTAYFVYRLHCGKGIFVAVDGRFPFSAFENIYEFLYFVVVFAVVKGAAYGGA